MLVTRKDNEVMRGKERKGKERKGKERKGKDRKGKERKGRKQNNLNLYLLYTRPLHKANCTLARSFR